LHNFSDFTFLRNTKNQNVQRIATINIETWKQNDSDLQFLSFITYAYYNEFGNIKFFHQTINHHLLTSEGVEVALTDLLYKFFQKIKIKKANRNIIYMYNLGSFDGFLLIASFVKNLHFIYNIDSLMDHKNKYIQIKANIFDMKLV
jgi:hypothetical protein